MHEMLNLPGDVAAAAALLKERSKGAPVLLFKKSPYCGVSAAAEGELLRWLGGRQGEGVVVVAEVDVIAERSLARGVTAVFGIDHQSPQAVLFLDGEVRWHGSHGELTAERFEEIVGKGGGS